MRYPPPLVASKLKLARALVCAAVFVSGMCSEAHATDPMQFRIVGTGGNCDTCTWIDAEGEITADTPSAFQELLKASADDYGSTFPTGWLVVLNSHGGNVLAAVELGEAFRKAQVTTAVASSEPDGPFFGMAPGACQSACFYAFVGGLRRSINPSYDPSIETSSLGVHRFALLTGASPGVSAQQLSGVLSGYLSRMGIDPQVLALASSIPEQNIHTITNGEAIRYHIVNVGLPASGWNLKPSADGHGLVAVLQGMKEPDDWSPLEFQYEMVLACIDLPGKPLRLTTTITSDVPFPADLGLEEDVGFGLTWTANGREFYAPALKPGGHPLDVFWPPESHRVDLPDLRMGAVSHHANVASVVLQLGPKSMRIVDAVQNLQFELNADNRATESWLPRTIPIAWSNRPPSLDSLLRKNCVRAGRN
jgi:hypothetical protein